ncbi:MAG: hypothetical protein G8345_08420 [Magnetococcales bacterium]|nr:hypothetical protein [Magnetococcales bacterium]NGZ26900.1 hypothetical protein [Magnetococcales bacterium]
MSDHETARQLLTMAIKVWLALLSKIPPHTHSLRTWIQSLEMDASLDIIGRIEKSA